MVFTIKPKDHVIVSSRDGAGLLPSYPRMGKDVGGIKSVDDVVVKHSLQ